MNRPEALPTLDAFGRMVSGDDLPQDQSSKNIFEGTEDTPFGLTKPKWIAIYRTLTLNGKILTSPSASIKMLPPS